MTLCNSTMDSVPLRDMDKIVNDSVRIYLDLHTSCTIGNSSRVKELLSKNPNQVDGRNKHGWTPLMYASASGHPEITRILIEHAANVNAQTKTGISPLILAAKCGNIEVVALLLQHGSTIDLYDDKQWTPLFHAVYMQQHHVVTHLLEKKANPNAIDLNGFTPFIIAASQRDKVLVKSFLKTDIVDVRHRSKSGKTARSIANEQRFVDVVKLIDDYIIEKSKLGICNQRTTTCGLESAVRPSDASEISNLESWLEHYGFSKYYYLFSARNIDLKIFLTLSEQDLEQIGIKLVGPRRKMHTEISKWKRKNPSRNDAYNDNFCSEFQRLTAGQPRFQRL